ncbi:MAG: GTPase ObgE [Deltaproteobacteria bacterium]|nr:GTPase ObgE [Deltaproteobacteria bacterium]
MARFIDEVNIYVKAGDGGAGAVSFRREKFVPRGGPDGGDGGKGGDVVFIVDRRLSSLIDLRYRKKYLAGKGGKGAGTHCFGKDGADAIIKVPVGTLVIDSATDEVIRDLVKDGERYVLCGGGKGGRGNAHFKSSTNQAPRYAQPGLPGEEIDLRLELKLLADVAIIGFPNAGKSTLITGISAARPKIGDYPFTTLVPNLGVVSFGDHGGYVVADIPGLIEGAHEGKGLGIQFLKHIERSLLLLHIIDLSPETGREPEDDYEKINNELTKFSADLAKRKQVVALNKTDITEASEKVPELLEYFKDKGIKVFEISAATGAGLKDLTNYIGTELQRMKDGTEES